MKLFQRFTTLLAVLIMTAGLSVYGGEPKPFNQALFKQAQAEGKTVVLDFHADWCSTCAKQKPVIESLLKEKELSPVVAFTVDFDNEKEIKNALKVQKQSTLVVFRGTKEVARQMGLTSRDEIKSLIQKGI